MPATRSAPKNSEGRSRIVSKIINLRTRRKQRARDAARETGNAATARSRESKTSRAFREREGARSDRWLDGHQKVGGEDDAAK